MRLLAFFLLLPGLAFAESAVVENKRYPGGWEYTGEVLRGQRHGSGSIVRETGSIKEAYHGSWHLDKKNGSGQWVSGSIVCEGIWKDDSQIGFGVLRVDGGRSNYHGEMENCVKSGKGELEIEGTFYEGLFEMNMFVSGTIRYPNGDSFIGNATTGRGTYRHANGDESTGYFSKHTAFHPLLHKAAENFWIEDKSPEEIEAEELALEQAVAQMEAEKRLSLCESFGFQRGTEALAKCAMELYIASEYQSVTEKDTDGSSTGVSPLEAASVSRSSEEHIRRRAIDEAILREQERVRRFNQSMKLIELGTGIATGSLAGGSTPKKSHTYTINGQIINCTTTGSLTNCF